MAANRAWVWKTRASRNANAMCFPLEAPRGGAGGGLPSRSALDLPLPGPDPSLRLRVTLWWESSPVPTLWVQGLKCREDTVCRLPGWGTWESALWSGSTGLFLTEQPSPQPKGPHPVPASLRVAFSECSLLVWCLVSVEQINGASGIMGNGKGVPRPPIRVPRVPGHHHLLAWSSFEG